MEFPFQSKREYFVKEFDIELSGTKEVTQIQYFCNSSNEPIYFPDRTLAALFHVNLSTLRGRLNRLTKKYEGYRLLISEKSKTRLSSFHFINWGKSPSCSTSSTSQQTPSSPPISSPPLNGNSSPLHGLVALNHVKLVNVALSDWIATNHERLGTDISFIEENFIKSDIPYKRQGDIITVNVTKKEDLLPPFPISNNFFPPYFPRQFGSGGNQSQQQQQSSGAGVSGQSNIGGGIYNDDGIPSSPHSFPGGASPFQQQFQYYNFSLLNGTGTPINSNPSTPTSSSSISSINCINNNLISSNNTCTNNNNNPQKRLNYCPQQQQPQQQQFIPIAQNGTHSQQQIQNNNKLRSLNFDPNIISPDLFPDDSISNGHNTNQNNNNINQLNGSTKSLSSSTSSSSSASSSGPTTTFDSPNSTVPSSPMIITNFCDDMEYERDSRIELQEHFDDKRKRIMENGNYILNNSISLNNGKGATSVCNQSKKRPYQTTIDRMVSSSQSSSSAPPPLSSYPTTMDENGRMIKKQNSFEGLMMSYPYHLPLHKPPPTSHQPTPPPHLLLNGNNNNTLHYQQPIPIHPPTTAYHNEDPSPPISNGHFSSHLMNQYHQLNGIQPSTTLQFPKQSPIMIPTNGHSNFQYHLHQSSINPISNGTQKKIKSNWIDCAIEGKNEVKRVDLSNIYSFDELKRELSDLFTLMSFSIHFSRNHINYHDNPSILSQLELDTTKEEWKEFCKNVGKLVIKPVNITPEIRNLINC
eukprot:gene5366-6696_t